VLPVAIHLVSPRSELLVPSCSSLRGSYPGEVSHEHSKHGRLRRPDRLAVAGLALILAGCGPHIAPPEEAVEEPSSPGSETDVGMGPDATSRASTSAGSDGDGGSSDGYPPLHCPDGQTQCGNECVDLRWSAEHCGACGHACTIVGGGGECWEGVCPPRMYCGLAEQSLSTCDSVCESYGETCVDTEAQVPSACGGDRYGLFYDLTPDFSCDFGYNGLSSVPGLCHDPIRWDLVGGPNGNSLPGAVGCCCTQP
jgi:hypothetical protein